MAGDGQEAAPASAVPVSPAIVVKDAVGRPVPGVTVAFSVDSGGGHVSNSSATTDAGGIAGSGAWTLGPAEASNVLVATVAGLGPVRIRAQGRFPEVVLADAVIPAGGGTITYTRAADPLDGFSLTVAAGAYAGSQTWHIASKPSLKVTLPAGVLQIGGGVSIGNDKDYSDSLVVIRLPLHVGADTAVAAFLYDPATGYFEMVPVASRDDGSITVVTTHVGTRFLWQPAPPTSAAPSLVPASTGFDPVTIFVAALPPPALTTPATSGFTPGVDDWEFANYGSYLAPGGACLGMSVTAMYYYDRVKLPLFNSLFHRFDHAANWDWDNPQGIRFASMIQYQYATLFSSGAVAREAAVSALAAKSMIGLDVLTYQSLIVAIRATNRPQLFALDNGPHTGGHAVVAYAVNNGSVRLADPNQPGQPGVTAIFSNGAFQPTNLSAKAGIAPHTYTRALVVGSSTYIPTPAIDAEYARFKAGTAGNGTFPAMYFESYEPLTATYIPLDDSVSVWADVLELDRNCPRCSPLQSLMLLGDETGNPLVDPVPLNLLHGRDSINVVAAIGGDFVDSRWTLVKSSAFDVLVTSAKPVIAQVTTTFAATAHGKAPPGADYYWDFGDNSPVVVHTGGDSLASHVFTETQPYHVTVEMRSPSGQRLSKAVLLVLVTFKLRVDPLSGVVQTPYTIVARGAIPDASTLYTWDFGDNTALIAATDSNATHSYANPGTYTLKVKYKYESVEDSATTVVRIYPGEWRLTSLSLQKTVLPKPGELPRRINAFDSLTKYLKQVEAKPSDGMFFLADGNLWTETGLYFQVAPPGTGASLVYWGPGSQVWMAARTSLVQFSNFQNTGTLHAGTLDGKGYVTLFYNPPAFLGGEFLNSISATKSGNTLSGTVQFTLYDGTGNPAQVSYTFSAQLVP